MDIEGEILGRPGSTRTHSLWSASDRWGAFRCRLGSFRMRYSVASGLYALGHPKSDSPVIVTATYKLTFDLLRRDLADVDCWILALDTGGVNVWCAAAGGRFSTDELVARIARSRLSQVVKHRELTVPQLGAVGISAHLVEKQTGFHVRFGPVRSRDLPAYLAAGSAVPLMRTVQFGVRDRFILVPMEMGRSLKYFLIFAIVAILYAGLAPGGVFVQKAWTGAWPLFALGLGAALAGSCLVPLLLPFIPSRLFSMKGWLAGAVVNGALLHGVGLARGMDAFLLAACWFFFPAVAGFLALLFTGATPFTSPSGVRSEVRSTFIFYLAAAVLTAAALVLSKVKLWGLL